MREITVSIVKKRFAIQIVKLHIATAISFQQLM